MTEAMPFLQKTILLSYDPRPFGGGLLPAPCRGRGRAAGPAAPGAAEAGFARLPAETAGGLRPSPPPRPLSPYTTSPAAMFHVRHLFFSEARGRRILSFAIDRKTCYNMLGVLFLGRAQPEPKNP